MGGFGIGTIFQEVGNMIRDDKAIVNGWLNNAWSAKQNKKAWERNLWMSSTAHQREVEDLRAAGLNPVLSAGQGASAPASLSVSPVMGQSHTSAPDFGQAFAKDAAKLVENEAAAKKAEAERAKADTKRVKAEADLTKAEADYVKRKTDGSALFDISPFDFKYYNTNSAGEPWQLKVIREGLWRGEGQGHRIGRALVDWFQGLTKDVGPSAGGRNSAKSIQQERKHVNPRSIPEEKPSKAHPFLNRKGFGNW